MFRTGARAALRSSQNSLAPARTTAGRRFITTDPPHLKSRSWKNSTLRWGLVAAGIYYYNTSPVFADSPQTNLLNPNVDAIDTDEDHSTLDALTASSRNKSKKNASALQSAIESSSETAASHHAEHAASLSGDSSPSPESHSVEAPIASGAADLEEEAESEGAFNPVTGEINWDCPCLGGMAYGPCGDEFKAAFSCFVYSNEDPKGMECIDKFQGMQECFRAHPEVYKGEIEDDEALDGELAQEKEELQREIQERRARIEERDQSEEGKETKTSSMTGATENKPSKTKARAGSKASKIQSQSHDDPQPEAKTTSHTPSEFAQEKESAHGAPSRTVSQRTTKAVDEDALPESDSLVPKAAHDATDTSSQDTQSIAK